MFYMWHGSRGTFEILNDDYHTWRIYINRYQYCDKAKTVLSIAQVVKQLKYSKINIHCSLVVAEELRRYNKKAVKATH